MAMRLVFYDVVFFSRLFCIEQGVSHELKLSLAF